MKKTLNLFVLSLLVLSIGFASATVTCENEFTTVAGTVYQNVIENVVPGASVTVTCNSNVATATTGSNGEYSVDFSGSECTYGDDVTVSATKDSLAGSEDGSITMTNTYKLPCGGLLKLNVGVVNVPMVPEFGVFVGALTLISAIGVFFMVRRK